MVEIEWLRLEKDTSRIFGIFIKRYIEQGSFNRRSIKITRLKCLRRLRISGNSKRRTDKRIS